MTFICSIKAVSYTHLDVYKRQFLYNGTWVKALETIRNNNADLRWEKKHEFNVGLDWEMCIRDRGTGASCAHPGIRTRKANSCSFSGVTAILIFPSHG